VSIGEQPLTIVDIRKNFARSLTSFIPFLSHSSVGSQHSLQIASRLELSQKQHGLDDKAATVNGEANGHAGLDVAALQLDAVMDLPTLNTRAGLYVFFNSLVGTRCKKSIVLTPFSSLHAHLPTTILLLITFIPVTRCVDIPRTPHDANYIDRPSKHGNRSHHGRLRYPGKCDVPK
jgi:hypothetical protein